MDPNRKAWNEGQKALRQALAQSDETAIELFLNQHAMVHSTEMAPSPFSFADEIWQDMDEQALRRIPQKEEHSIVWILWHLARIEDMTMNILVAGRPQLLNQDDWLEKLAVPYRHSGNAMTPEEVADLSQKIDIQALRAYRMAVGRNTRKIVQPLAEEDLKKKVDPAGIAQVKDEGAVIEAAYGVTDYWSKRTIAGLLFMPPTRHCFLHFNEALKIKKKL